MKWAWLNTRVHDPALSLGGNQILTTTVRSCDVLRSFSDIIFFNNYTSLRVFLMVVWSRALSRHYSTVWCIQGGNRRVEAVAGFVVKGFGQWTQINRAVYAFLVVIIFISYRGRSVAQKVRNNHYEAKQRLKRILCRINLITPEIVIRAGDIVKNK